MTNVFTLDEIKAKKQDGFVGLAGNVWDLSKFADEHPGGAELSTPGGTELIEDWFGSDGTEEFTSAHPEGLAIIKRTLSKVDFAAALKGTFKPSEKKPSPIKRKPSPAVKNNGGKKEWFSPIVSGLLLLWQFACMTMPVYFALDQMDMAPSLGFITSSTSSSNGSRTNPGGSGGSMWNLLPERWPTQQHLVQMLIGAVISMILNKFFQIYSGDGGGGVASVQPVGGDRGSGVGGWTYGAVTPELVAKIRDACPEDGQVYVAGDSDDADRQIKTRAKDMSFHKRCNPDIVVFPRSAEEVQAVVKAAYDASVPVVPRGAGSGLEGGAIPYQGGVVLDLMKMKKFKLHKAEMQAQVEPGIKKSELNALLEPEGLLFGPDPASNPSVGGMASTRGSGLSTLMYGTTAENVVTLKVVTPEGKLVQTRRRVRKSSTGYEMTQLYVGSEGTLGIIVELTLKLWTIPTVRCGAFVRFESLHDAATATIALVHASLPTLCRCELLNSEGVKATNKKFGTNLKPSPTIFLEYRGDSLDICKSEAARGQAVMEANEAKAYTFAGKGSELDKLWEARRGCYLASISYDDRKGNKVFISDTCVPISNVAQMISETEDDFTQKKFPCIICAHIADGNFHCCVPYQPDRQMDVLELENRMIERALRYDGTVSGEHGVGVGKIGHIIAEHGEDHINLQRAVKRALDPRNIMNPGKIFILPRHEGGCCDVPHEYHQTEAYSGGTYEH